MIKLPKQNADDKATIARHLQGSQAEPMPTEVIADSIVAIANGMRKLRAGRLTDKALVILLHHASGVGQREIQTVLNAMAELEHTYLRKPNR
jgi:hypothetical protein